jgi:hypothetical protein
MTPLPLPARKLSRATTAELIAQYDLVTYGPNRGGMPNDSMRRRRISRICDLVLARAEAGDRLADQWLKDA